MILNLPTNKSLKEKGLYFWLVSHPDWVNGRRRRVRRSYRDARRLSNLVGYTVEYCSSQKKPPGAEPGSQGALIYGGRVKRKKKKD